MEDVKLWLQGTKRGEETERNGNDCHEGAGKKWWLLVRLVQYVWETEDTPGQLLTTIVVLIPKGSSGGCQGIGLLEVV